MITYPGNPFPLGATLDAQGVNFAIYSQNATSVELCLFDNEQDATATATVAITEKTGNIWHVYLPGIKAGQLYAYRVDGPYAPSDGLRFNRNKLLLDPNAKAITPWKTWDSSMFGYDQDSPDEDLSFSETDSAPFMPRCVVIDPAYDWEGDTRPNIPLHKTIIYEVHVKGFTMTHPDIPEEIRGTYKAMAHPAAINYLRELGVTAVELMPVHYYPEDQILLDKGLSNYWGYNTLGFFAPQNKYASVKDGRGSEVTEFKDMVKALHQAGIEVILDVVYNHTAEGNHMGPTLSFKGIDNSMYYRLMEERRFYNDYTGTGNTMNAQMPAVLRLIMDSLRYWIVDMHVDGFRFDLASALARESHEVDKLGSFLDIIYQDPVISQVKLIAEPWDIGEGGYQVGNFPPGWSEWNGKYRDCMRDFWKGGNSPLGEFANRFTGSSDLYQDDSRKPTASINFITAHDGFTLADLVSYNEKHNERNGEDNNDGMNDNRSWNCGAEGPTEDEQVIALRKKQQRNLLSTLFLSIGVPMLVAGDELGKTQQGNNNCYCQDNELSWINWQQVDGELLEFTKSIIKLVTEHPVFRRKRWFHGEKITGGNAEDIAWFKPDSPMTDDDWNQGSARSLMIFLNGKGIKSLGPKGERITDDNFCLIFNAHHEPVTYKLPPAQYGAGWQKLVDTEYPKLNDVVAAEPESALEVSARSVVVLLSKQQ